MTTDTIAAIATAPTNAGIGIIRISGEDALLVADRLYRTKSGQRKLQEYESHTIHYGFVYDEDTLLDEVMAVVMLAPKSYTAENTVELQCHGGVFVLQKILQAVIKNGARLAEPGEFTKRAFLNGRIDLSKAEAVIDVIHAKNEFALRASAMQLKGSVSQLVRSLRGEILYEIAYIESALDDPEHISLDGYYERLSGKLADITARLQTLLDTADNGRMLKEGIHTVIVGKPNAGKSSLLNLLLGEERAIVTDIAGTTRDALEESLTLDGIGFNIIDTAGIRSTTDTVERIGVQRAKKYAKDADLIVYVVDASLPLDESDEEILSLVANKNVIVLLNKTDLENVVTEEQLRGRFTGQVRMLKTSIRENTGIDLFKNAVKELFYEGKIIENDELIITNMRHKEALQNACDSLRMVQDSMNNGMPEDFLTIDLMSAYSSLGFIIGEEVGEDLVQEIFSKFCMGK